MDRLDVLDRTSSNALESDTLSHHESDAVWAQTVSDTRQSAARAIPVDSSSHTAQNNAPATTHTVEKGETLSELATRYGLQAHDLAAANPAIQNPDLLHVGQTLNIPLKTGAKLPGLHAVQPGETLSGLAQRYQSSVPQIAQANNIHDPDLVRAGTQLWIPGAGGQVPAPANTQPHQPATPPAKPNSATAPAKPQDTAKQDTGKQAQAILTAAQAQTDPTKALQTLNSGYTHASQAVKDAVLADPNAGKIFDAAAKSANQPLTQKADNGVFPQAQTLQAITKLDKETQGLDKTLAGAVVDRAVSGYEAFQKDPNHGGVSVFGSQGVSTLMSLSGRITGTAQGDDAIKRFAATGAWDANSVTSSIGSGTNPAYALAVAQQIKGAGQDPHIVMQAVTDGVEAFKAKTKDDVTKLAQHDSELAWLVQNDGAGMTPQQLNQAVDAYRTQKGPDWQKQETALQQQISSDGSKLVQQMVALNQAAPKLSGSQQSIDSTLKTLANDPSAGLAISTAIQSDPKLADAQEAGNVADVFTLSKVGDIGRKFTNEMGAAYVRRNVLDKMQGVDLNNPDSVAEAKQAIGSLNKQTFARLIGVSSDDTKKAVKALQGAVDRAAADPQNSEAVLSDLNNTLNNDASLSKAFNKTTMPGQLLRGVAVGFAGVSLINSYNKFKANPKDPQNDIKLMVDSAGFAQKNSELLVGLGAVNKQSAVGQFGGEWKLAGRASAGDLLTGISAVLDGVSAVRSGFGLGTKQDTGSAIFSATSSVGGLMAVAPAFGAAAWLGPVGLGVAAVGVIGNTVYQDVKGAHQYEGASESFLKAAGYNDAAAKALSKQDGIISGASGAAQMPFLAQYAKMKHLDPAQLQSWVNSLSPDQVQDLSSRLLQTAGDAKGNASDFTNGPPQTVFIDGGGFAVPITLTNTLGEFEKNLAYDHVPHP